MSAAHTSLVRYTNDDDGIHLRCVCGWEVVFHDHSPTVDELATTWMAHAGRVDVDLPEWPPPWERLAAEIAELVKFANDSRVGLHNVDQMAAYATGFLAEGNVDLRDPRTLYEALAVLSLVRAAAATGTVNGVITDEEAQAVRVICKVIGAALTTLLPAEAKK